MDKILELLPINNIKSINLVPGGDVNESYKLDADGGSYFLKVHKNKDAIFFEGEKAGLKIFEEKGIYAPRALASGQADGAAFLLLTYHEEKREGRQEDLAKVIAQIHQIKSPNGKFGFDYPYIGQASKFDNSYKDSWKEIFLHQRMDKLASMLKEFELWDEKDLARYEEVRFIIEKELDKHKSEPVLLHGDLWAGNFMFDEDERPLVFDPAPLYGDREFDIGVSTVFGGFGNAFYNEYKDLLPMEEGYQERLNFYRLFLLMKYLLRFGPVYDSSVNDMMKIITN